MLIQPPGLCSDFTRNGSLYPPLGLLQIAANTKNHLVEVLDADGLRWDNETTKNYIADFHPDVVGLSSTAYTLEMVKEWADISKSAGAIVVVGGPQATVDPVGVFNVTSSIDYVFRGEAEQHFQFFLDSLEQKKDHIISGISQRRKNELSIDPLIHQISELSDITMSRYGKMPIGNYWCPDSTASPMVTIATTRGCPHKCGFCSSPIVSGRKIRRFSINEIISTIEYVSTKHGVRQFSFVDDVLTINRKHLFQLCASLKKISLDISFFGNARADQIDEEIATSLKSAGCHQLYLGFESGSQDILDSVSKGTSIEKLVYGAEVLRKAGIGRSIGFIIGLPGESEETVRKSIQLAKRIKPERLQFTKFTPLPGSPLANKKLSTNHGGFHGKTYDQIDRWVDMAYAECGYGSLENGA
nr:radical SAM protein [Candidatus Thiosymbion oneisti]